MFNLHAQAARALLPLSDLRPMERASEERG
jgi:hypothetical protein